MKRNMVNEKNKIEDLGEIENKGKKLEALINLTESLRELERRMPITFNDFLYQASEQPDVVFRDVFQVFSDMVHYYVQEPEDDFEETDESIGFIPYNLHDLFLHDCDTKFFADRIFSYRFMNLVKMIRKGVQKNRIFLFEGPPGSGKSTFLNNLLKKFEDYSKTPAGTTYKVYWRLDINKLGGFQHLERKLHGIAEANESDELSKQLNTYKSERMLYPEKYLEFSCPNHDHPILMIPKAFRVSFLEELITDNEFKERLFSEKQFEWILKDIPCNICSSIYKSILDDLGDPIEAYNMIYARKNFYNRQLGEGISVFNPGDPVYNKHITNPTLQKMINDLLKNDDVKFITSYLAKTNNGILGLMDIKEFNVDRLKNYHGIISDGVHKVELAEESIKTLFLGLVNPEDTIHYEKVKSFQDRIITVSIPYILDYKTEVEIYKSSFGDQIEQYFLPQVLENFAKIIVSSRLEKESPSIKKWLGNLDKYKLFTDKDGLLLKLDIYTGKLPTWLSEEDTKKFDKSIRKDILTESEKEGQKGISGRQSLSIINSFILKFADEDNLITLENIREFFVNNRNIYGNEIPASFILSLIDLYDYDVLQQVKEAIFYYNQNQIKKDIMNYLFAINFETGDTKKCDYTGDIIDINDEFLKNFEAIFLGTTSTVMQRQEFRRDIHSEYISKTLSQEISIEGKTIDQTEQFKTLFEKYQRYIKENSLAPFMNNENFRRAVLDYNTDSFAAYDDRIKKDVKFLINNLIKKFNYNLEGAKQISVYVLDKKSKNIK